MPHDLTSAVIRYKKTAQGPEAIIHHIVTAAYLFAQQNRFCREDDCAGFLLSFYPRIPGVISRYRPASKDFPTYLRNCFLWHMKTYLARRIRRRCREEALRDGNLAACGGQEDIWQVCEPEPEELLIPGDGEQHRDGQYRLKILLLALKSANEVNDRLISRTAARTGMHSAVVFHLIEVLRTVMGNRIRRTELLLERRRRGYFRLQYFAGLRRICRDKFQELDLEKRIGREKRRCGAVDRTLAVIPKSPSHGDIARILGIPKGTIDSSYFYMRRAWERKKPDA
jgi:hypothetical protein